MLTGSFPNPLKVDAPCINVTKQVMKKKILVIDDSPFFLKTLTDALSGSFHVETAISGEEAIEILKAVEADESGQSTPFDLIITDLTMPGLSGYDVAAYVKRQNRTNRFTPVIMLTGNDITKEEARQHGCAAYVPKDNLQKVVSMAGILLRI